MTKKTQLKEGVLDNHDDDGWMAKSQLYQIAKYAIELHKMIQDTDSLEPWVQSKITKAVDYIDTVKHYMEYERFKPEPAPAAVTSVSESKVFKKNVDIVTREIMEFNNTLAKKDVLPMIESIAGKNLKIKEFVEGGESKKKFLVSLKENLKKEGFNLKKDK